MHSDADQDPNRLLRAILSHANSYWFERFPASGERPARGLISHLDPARRRAPSSDEFTADL